MENGNISKLLESNYINGLKMIKEYDAGGHKNGQGNEINLYRGCLK